ncbi:DUF4367 domain-containing protein [Paenibacillus harenae]|uniref:DUF4367 domain-containing protein n=1 Tax=Paenibacillus harenae TaxID=306543 RepID=A0ABT9TXE2_PAEHA|nr:DUF4367 domain-containing protein [Paenibacillus harenae]MDQ0111993.1 hypothetical protein [Paenibacillus harenae]
MGTFATDPNEELIKCHAPEYPYRTIDVTSRVMIEIESLQKKKRVRNRALTRMASISVAALCIILASITAYAATGHLKIFYGKGDVIAKTTESSSTVLPAKLIELLNEYDNRVAAELEPGELAAYYIDNDYINFENGYDTVNPIKSKYTPIDYRSYDDFLKEQLRTSAPVLKSPSYLPQGVSFLHGQVFPSFGADRVEFEKIKTRLMDRAFASPNEEKLYIEKVEWTKASTTVAYYSYESQVVDFSIQAVYGRGLSLSEPKNGSSEKILLEDIEAIYMQDEDKEFGGMTLGWYDERQKTFYIIRTNEDSVIEKQTIVKMAESMIP